MKLTLNLARQRVISVIIGLVSGILIAGRLHFYYWGDDHNCKGCKTNSVIIRVAVEVLPSTSLATPTATAVPPPSNINSTVADLLTSTLTSAPDHEGKISLGVGLGVKLGVGIPVFLAAVGVFLSEGGEVASKLQHLQTSRWMRRRCPMKTIQTARIVYIQRRHTDQYKMSMAEKYQARCRG